FAGCRRVENAPDIVPRRDIRAGDAGRLADQWDVVLRDGTKAGLSGTDPILTESWRYPLTNRRQLFDGTGLRRNRRGFQRQRHLARERSDVGASVCAWKNLNCQLGPR